ncbi:DUF6247 family protein [Microbispora bryophytorum]|uniref:DUF6247 family protein n=1 Tax=Microbispora bryophytorum TaxID=1460882 RepID=UPI00371DD7D5
MRKAGDELDLTRLHECVETWRRHAVLKADPDEYARMIERTEETQRRADLGEPTGGIPWDEAFETRLRSRELQGAGWSEPGPAVAGLDPAQQRYQSGSLISSRSGAGATGPRDGSPGITALPDLSRPGGSGLPDTAAGSRRAPA